MPPTDSSVLPKYWTDVERSESHRVQLDLIEGGSRVLEIGAAAGHMTRALSGKGCEVTAVEQDATLAESARRFCQRLVVTDVESEGFEKHLEGERFDVILLGDVLEHLKEPDAFLKRLRRHLSPRGCLVACVPNVAHGAVRLALLQGHFDYRPAGLLDRTHLRFFTRTSLSSMLDDAGYVISDLQEIRCGFFVTEIPLDLAQIPVGTLRLLCRDPEATAYQFVLRAYPQDSAVPALARNLACTPQASWDGRQLTLELLQQYERLGREALFEHPRDVYRARQLFYCAFGLEPSFWRLSRLCASFLPARIVHHLGRVHDWLRRRGDRGRHVAGQGR